MKEDKIAFSVSAPVAKVPSAPASVKALRPLRDAQRTRGLD